LIFALSRRSLSGGPSQNMTTMYIAETVDSSSVQQLNARSIDHATVDAGHAYMLAVIWSRGATSNDNAIRNRFHGCSLFYQKP
jgi:hypothetical protein